MSCSNFNTKSLSRCEARASMSLSSGIGMTSGLSKIGLTTRLPPTAGRPTETAFMAGSNWAPRGVVTEGVNCSTATGCGAIVEISLNCSLKARASVSDPVRDSGAPVPGADSSSSLARILALSSGQSDSFSSIDPKYG